MFIVIDGIDGAGKGTLCQSLKEYFISKGVPVTLTREPGGTPLSESIRELLLSNNDEKEHISNITELLLMSSARQQNITNVILPALESGHVVISDRYIPSTIAYQSYGRGIDINTVKTINEIATGGLLPDLTIILSVNSDVSINRVKSQDKPPDRIEKMKSDFFNRCREGYSDYVKICSEEAVVIDGNKNRSTVLEEAILAISRLN